MRRFGLRPRLLAALVLSSVVTLAVAAAALLSPLEQRLRVDGESGVIGALIAARPEFHEIKIEPTTGLPDRFEVRYNAQLLRQRTGGQVTMLDRNLETVYPSPGPSADESFDIPDYFAQARRAFTTSKPMHGLVGNELVAAGRIQLGTRHYVVVVVKRLDYVSSAVGVVETAFIEAAAVGLGIALLLGIGFATALSRRLERLRGAAREFEFTGTSQQFALRTLLGRDSRQDEIGELAGAFFDMQERIHRQEQARRTFLTTASHELRTPLTSLEGMLELLQEDLDPDQLDLQDARERTTRAREQSRRLSHLATDLLDLNRLDAEVTLRTEPLELSELARAVVAEFELRAAEHKVLLEIQPAPAPCWVNADPGAVARIVRILLDNALRVAPPGTSIEVKIQADESRPRVLVCDYGPGVPASERDLIFERFSRGSNSGTSPGFGLGLAIGRELATRMGGILELLEGDQTQEQSGACFCVQLPVATMGDPQADSELGLT
ncbi:MAG: sensor histidine kinase [Solirubrobacteraceae bacterium]